MKKVRVLVTVLAFIISGVGFHSCKKDEVSQVPTTANMELKVTSTYDLPIYMGQTTLIGEAFIYINANGMIQVDVDLDETYLMAGGWEVMEAHLYASMEPPSKASPGQFPYPMYDPGYDFSFDPIAWECGQVEWYFSLHLQLIDPDGYQETAWILPGDEGINWTKPNGTIIGWGEYFLWEFDWVPVIGNITLVVTDDFLYTEYIYEGDEGYEICLNGDPETYYYFDALINVTGPLAVNYLNEFYMTPIPYDPTHPFYVYWAGKGVFPGCVGAWEPYMMQILEGTLPIFYVNWDEADFQLIDGLQHQLYLLGIPGYTGTEPLRMNGDYPYGTYEYSGYLMSDHCPSALKTITLIVGCPE